MNFCYSCPTLMVHLNFFDIPKNTFKLYTNIKIMYNHFKFVMNIKKAILDALKAKFLITLKETDGLVDKHENNDVNFTKENQKDRLFYHCMKSEQESQNTWFLDNCCSNHLAMNSKFFVELDYSFLLKVIRLKEKVSLLSTLKEVTKNLFMMFCIIVCVKFISKPSNCGLLLRKGYCLMVMNAQYMI
jgi:hypothetical protein